MAGLGDARAAHRTVVGRFAAHLAQVPDGSVRVPHLDWTVSELGAHVLSGLRAYTRAVRDGTPMWPDSRDSEGGNRALIEATPERDPAAIVAAIPQARDELHAALDGREGEVPAWGDVRVPVALLPAMHVGDVAVHGWDLSRATRRPWVIQPSEALVTLEAMFAVVPHYVNEQAARGLRATYGISLRGGPAWTARFDGGALETTAGAPDRADCRLAADPVAFLLLAYRRLPLWRAALTGRAVAYGRKPWLGLRFTGLLDAP